MLVALSVPIDPISAKPVCMVRKKESVESEIPSESLFSQAMQAIIFDGDSIMLDQIVAAIGEMRRLEIYYEPGSRLIEPHAVGYSKDGNVLLRAFQVSGASASGEHVHWKLFRLDRMVSVHPTADRFTGPRAGYKTGDKAMKGGIISELPPHNRMSQAS